MARTRLIRPEFFADDTIATVPIETRYFYIGLWTLCDDAGYFEWKLPQIAIALFPWDPRESREALVDDGMQRLVDAGRVKSLECGVHGIVPTIVRHGAKGGNRAENHKRRHLMECQYVRVRTSTARVEYRVEESRARAQGNEGGGLKAVLGDFNDIVGKKH